MANPKSRKRPADSSPDDSVEDPGPKGKKQKKTPSTEVQRDDDGNEYWEISGKRRLQINDFKGNIFVNIREFYEKDGKTLPGKKGIALSIEQYTAFVELLPAIEGVLKGKGVEVPRPQYGGSTGGKEAQDEEEEEEDGEAEQGEDADGEDGAGAEAEAGETERKGRLDKFKFGGKGKKNYEATSDEDEGD